MQMVCGSPSLAFFRTPSLRCELLVVVPSRKAHAILSKDFRRRERGKQHVGWKTQFSINAAIRDLTGCLCPP